MKVNVSITHDILRRSAYVHPAFTATDSAFPLALKPLLPGIHVYRSYAGFCDHNGYEQGFTMTPEMTEFYDIFEETPPKYRADIKPRKLLLELPKSIITYFGEPRLVWTLRSSPNLRLTK